MNCAMLINFYQEGWFTHTIAVVCLLEVKNRENDKAKYLLPTQVKINKVKKLKKAAP